MNDPSQTPSVRLKVQVWIRWANPTGESRFLLLRTLPERADFWQPVTGSVEAGETEDQAALREATEESGLKFTGAPQSIGYEFTYDGMGWVAGKRFHEKGFTLSVASDVAPPVTVDAHEHQAYRWVTADEAFGLMRFPDNAKMLRTLLESSKKRD